MARTPPSRARSLKGGVGRLRPSASSQKKSGSDGLDPRLRQGFGEVEGRQILGGPLMRAVVGAD